MTVDERLTELEIRLTHQENTIDELNKTIFEQWQVIEMLQKQVQNLKDRQKAITASNIDDRPYVPPHY